MCSVEDFVSEEASYVQLDFGPIYLVVDWGKNI